MASSRILVYSRHRGVKGREGRRLPDGVDRVEWSKELASEQNPRIRALLRALARIEEFVDANYTILHCSTETLSEILRKARRTSEILESDFAPLLESPSVVPNLEKELEGIRRSYGILCRTAFTDLRRLAVARARSEQMGERKLLSLCIGRLYAFIQDSFARIVSADPRSQHDCDHFLNKRFEKEIEASEWLHYSVVELREYLKSIDGPRTAALTDVVSRIRSRGALPGKKGEVALERFLARIESDLLPRLRALLVQPGVRYEELEVLDQYVVEIPKLCSLAQVLWDAATASRQEIDAMRGGGAVGSAQASDVVLGELYERIAEQIEVLDRRIRDFTIFVPFWQYGIEGRRSWRLALGRSE